MKRYEESTSGYYAKLEAELEITKEIADRRGVQLLERDAEIANLEESLQERWEDLNCQDNVIDELKNALQKLLTAVEKLRPEVDEVMSAVMLAHQALEDEPTSSDPSSSQTS